ncbi:hypothetical protein ACJZ2D_006381 [Fusarium nematophilum]
MSIDDSVLDQIVCHAASQDDAESNLASETSCHIPTPVTRESDGPDLRAPSVERIEDDPAHAACSTEADVSEENVYVRVAEEISRGPATVISPTGSRGSDEYHEVIEFHEGVTPVTIVGGAIGCRAPNRLTCIKLRSSSGPAPAIGPGLHAVDMEYLEKKGALNLPCTSTCSHLLRLYFTCVYPYAPILDPIEFMKDYHDGRQSFFLLQSIFANVVPHAPLDCLHDMGYRDRMAAQQELYSRATLLYDLGHEKSQLGRLQGSIMLSSLSFSYAGDKDYRYWFSNACRIATQMGLHRQYISERLSSRFRKLFRRIWWILYNRDVLMAVSGLSNLRNFDDRFCDSALLTEDDWADDAVPPELAPVLSGDTRLQKVYMIENCKLSVTSSHLLDCFTPAGRVPSGAEIESLENEIMEWKRNLDTTMSMGALHDWNVDNIWILVLLAMSFRLEAVFYRALGAHFRRSGDDSSLAQVTQKQDNAMFELSSIIQRASLHQVIGHADPLNSASMTCASTILAMRIEIALDPGTNPKRRFTAKMQVNAEIEYLREACQYWTSLTWTLRMFEAAILRMGLNIDTSSSVAPNVTSSRLITTANEHGQNIPQYHELDIFLHPETPTGQEAYLSIQNGSINADGIEAQLDFRGMLPMTGNYDWIESLLIPHHPEESQLHT